MSGISTHILDTTRGRPAAGVNVRLLRQAVAGVWHPLGAGVTDAGGRIQDLLAGDPLETGIYRLTFETGDYHRGQGATTFYPEVSIDFIVQDAEQHHHVPLLLSPFGYTTYRGS